jgi:hypothetical protein
MRKTAILLVAALLGFSSSAALAVSANVNAKGNAGADADDNAQTGTHY